MVSPLGAIFDFDSDDVQRARGPVNDTCCYCLKSSMHMHSMQKTCLMPYRYHVYALKKPNKQPSRALRDPGQRET